MADELSDYLQGDYLDEKRDIERLQDLGSQVLKVFDDFFIKSKREWPYEVVEGDSVSPPDRFSFSTNAMIVFSLAVATGRISHSQLIPTLRHAPLATPADDKFPGLVVSMRESLARFPSEITDARSKKPEVQRWKKAQRERRRKTPGDVELVTTSETFGPNDPLTLTWLVEVLGKGTPAESAVAAQLLEELIPAAREIVTSAFERPNLSPLRLPLHELVPHAFPLLRALHLSKTKQVLEGDWQPEATLDATHDYLLNRAHFHLSSVSIKDGGFDAGELVFSLEGVLLCDPSSPDYTLFDRAFEVLAERQRETPYWRPLRPFRVTSRGMVLLPQSIEIANSLLRICSRLDEGRDRSYFSDYVDLFKAYTRWLESRVVVGMTKGQASNNIFGWQSEHTFAPNRIHLWQTSQALLFMIHYTAMLQGHIARRSFRAAHFSGGSTSSLGRPITSSWGEWEKGEPMGSLSSEGPYAVYRRISDSIIGPREAGSRSDSDWASSALLYGPPGTGKSTIAKEIAKALGYRQITITPSDFITAGQEGVETRAKNIFSTLMEQTKLVVLFDEVDQLLLDRGSELYRLQGDIFKLITPGMLTKLSDLAERKEVVFLVATNYIERIDAAIKRPGRINERLLVLPPDAVQRRRFMTQGPKGQGPIFQAWETANPDDWDEVVKRTALYTYKELQDLAKRVGKAAGEGSTLVARILERCSEFPPTISIASYKNRVLKKRNGTLEPNEEGPLEEFVMVAYIAAQSDQVKASDRAWIGAPLKEAWSTEAVSRKQDDVWNVLTAASLVELEGQS